MKCKNESCGIEIPEKYIQELFGNFEIKEDDGSITKAKRMRRATCPRCSYESVEKISVTALLLSKEEWNALVTFLKNRREDIQMDLEDLGTLQLLLENDQIQIPLMDGWDLGILIVVHRANNVNIKPVFSVIDRELVSEVGWLKGGSDELVNRLEKLEQFGYLKKEVTVFFGGDKVTWSITDKARAKFEGLR